MKALVESLLADGHYNLCNSDFAQWPVTPILKRVNKWNRIMSFSCKKVTRFLFEAGAISLFSNRKGSYYHNVPLSDALPPSLMQEN